MNYWNKEGFFHKGYLHQGVEELDEAIHKCDMCGKEDIRFVHTMYHPELPDFLRVGCVCAEKMTNDYVNPKLKEKLARNKSTWIHSKWKLENLFEYEEKNFNSKYGRITVGIFKVDDHYQYHLDDFIYPVYFKTKLEAKKFVFDNYKDQIVKYKKES